MNFATVLAILGDTTGLNTLLRHVRQARWDEGWDHRGPGRFSMSPLDGKLVALGWAGDRRAVPVILEKLKQLKTDSAFSHWRAAALGLEMLGDPAAAQPLADSLRLPGIAGYAHTTIEETFKFEVGRKINSVQTRLESLRELMLARALYRCGDCETRGETTLRLYARDLRGHLSRHATAVLESGKKD